MFDDEIAPLKRNHVREIPIAPILDMLVAVIFFLLLSTSFIQFSQKEIPPSAVVETEMDAASEPPLSPKIVVRRYPSTLRLVLRWSGGHPGQVVRDLPTDGDYGRKLLSEGQWISRYFANQFPTVTSVQLGFTGDVSYQDVITVIDGIRQKIPDIVLMSYRDSAEMLGN